MHKAGPANSMMAFAKGYAAAATGGDVDREVATLDTLAKGITAPEMRYRSKLLEIQKLEVEALAASKKGDQEKAIAAIKKAVELEETNSPPSGPPEVIKPPHELYGEILLQAGRPQEAAQMFAASLSREPNRARSVLGSARAAKAMGDARGASQAYAEFLRVWHEADPGLPEINEARTLGKTTGGD
jgi:tetratricopeptide (TPR) repeat protein